MRQSCLREVWVDFKRADQDCFLHIFTDTMEDVFEKGWMVTLPLIIISGIAGTALMTLFMYTMSYVTDKVMKVPKLLGIMITMGSFGREDLKKRQFSLTLGVLVHYLIGIVFMFCYYELWSAGFGGPDFLTGLFFGFVSGGLAIAIWYSFFVIHPNPPEIPLRSYLSNLFVAHFLFVLGCFLSFRVLAHVSGFSV